MDWVTSVADSTDKIAETLMARERAGWGRCGQAGAGATQVSHIEPSSLLILVPNEQQRGAQLYVWMCMKTASRGMMLITSLIRGRLQCRGPWVLKGRRKKEVHHKPTQTWSNIQ